MSTTVQDVILHWYPESPFSQKVAWVLNYKKIDYKVVLIDRCEPRPLRRPLDGGYRKTPILQIGNHVYCDTKAIFLAIEKYFPENSLYPKLTTNPDVSSEAVARGLTVWMDNTLFFNVVSQIPLKALDETFIKDRNDLVGGRFNVDVMAAAAPFMKATLKAEFSVAESILGDKTWVLDTETPSLVDFSLSMLTFFCLNLVGEKWVQTNLKSIYEHMARVMSTSSWDATESRLKLTEEEAVEVLKRHESDTLAEGFEIHSSILPIELGQLVSVTPLDTGKIPVTGTLIRSTVDETVISYKNTEHNTTSIIHFPTIGFIVVPAQAQAK
ncbi:Homeodomain-like protein [Mucor velutinosus]|uniref:Homeodomain-like protein n=1 Tax=Mucor velutinosus TaxID=708070 RepID=A0AAN7DE62_9FUNG|nr:Homeodomain-like protein [Mucor velutinosus]